MPERISITDISGAGMELALVVVLPLMGVLLPLALFKMMIYSLDGNDLWIPEGITDSVAFGDGFWVLFYFLGASPALFFSSCTNPREWYRLWISEPSHMFFEERQWHFFFKSHKKGQWIIWSFIQDGLDVEVR